MRTYIYKKNVIDNMKRGQHMWKLARSQENKENTFLINLSSSILSSFPSLYFFLGIFVIVIS